MLLFINKYLIFLTQPLLLLISDKIGNVFTLKNIQCPKCGILKNPTCIYKEISRSGFWICPSCKSSYFINFLNFRFWVYLALLNIPLSIVSGFLPQADNLLFITFFISLFVLIFATIRLVRATIHDQFIRFLKFLCIFYPSLLLIMPVLVLGEVLLKYPSLATLIIATLCFSLVFVMIGFCIRITDHLEKKRGVYSFRDFKEASTPKYRQHEVFQSILDGCYWLGVSHSNFEETIDYCRSLYSKKGNITIANHSKIKVFGEKKSVLYILILFVFCSLYWFITSYNADDINDSIESLGFLYISTGLISFYIFNNLKVVRLTYYLKDLHKLAIAQRENKTKNVANSNIEEEL